jgi:thioredoxin reductase (NADPH)
MSPEVSTLATRRHQTFPVLDAQELQRVRRFGEPRHFEAGENLATAGQRSQGVMVILSGNVRVSRRDVTGVDEHIVT